ncbi:hypothetical protein GC167_08160 [bacterium]|nr:hypothetical protein [bacterium]
MIPKFLLGDNSDLPEAVFVIHTEFPRFILDLDAEEVEWLDEVDVKDDEELSDDLMQLIDQAQDFYERELDRYEAMDEGEDLA